MIARCGLLTALSCLASFTCFAPAQQDAPLRVGFSSVDVTPDIAKAPAYLAGFGKNRKATKIHDPIMARAVVLEHGGLRLAFVSVDVVGLFYDLVESVRPRLKGVTYLCVTATHNHHGPDTIGMWGPNLFTSGVNPDYMKQLENAIVTAVENADASLAKVHEVRIGQTRSDELLRDSRQPIVKHDELTALQFLDSDKKTLGVVTTWNCHPEALPSNNPEMSADYVATTAKHLEEKYHAPVVYLTGTVGGLMTPDTSKFKDEKGNRLPDSFKATELYGIEIGKLTEKALADGRIAKITPFEVLRREIYLPISNNAFVLAFRLGVVKRNSFGWTGDVSKGAHVNKDDEKQKLAVKTEIAKLRLGELEIAAIPGEIYPELVLGKFQDPVDPAADFPDAPLEPHIYGQLKAPFRMVIGLANDELGYIIPKRQWDENPPFCYGRKSSQYGEINSLGAETAPLLCNAFVEMVKKGK